MRDSTDEAIAKFASEIAQRIPEGEGFVALQRIKDEDYIRGDRTGLITLGTAILLRATAEKAYQPIANRMYGMVPGGFLEVLPVTDGRELAKLRRRTKDAWWACGLMVVALVLITALACVGLYTVAVWIL